MCSSGSWRSYPFAAGRGNAAVPARGLSALGRRAVESAWGRAFSDTHFPDRCTIHPPAMASIWPARLIAAIIFCPTMCDDIMVARNSIRAISDAERQREENPLRIVVLGAAAGGG